MKHRPIEENLIRISEAAAKLAPFGWEHLGGWLFRFNGDFFDLSAADLSKRKEIEKERLFRIKTRVEGELIDRLNETVSDHVRRAAIETRAMALAQRRIDTAISALAQAATDLQYAPTTAEVMALRSLVLPRLEKAIVDLSSVPDRLATAHFREAVNALTDAMGWPRCKFPPERA